MVKLSQLRELFSISRMRFRLEIDLLPELRVVTAMMKPLFAAVLLASGVATNGSHAAPQFANTSARHARALHFARGAYKLNVTGNLNKNSRFYTLKVNAGQHLKISARSAGSRNSAVVPLIFVTPPCGKYNGDKNRHL